MSCIWSLGKGCLGLPEIVSFVSLRCIYGFSATLYLTKDFEPIAFFLPCSTLAFFFPFNAGCPSFAVLLVVALLGCLTPDEAAAVDCDRMPIEVSGTVVVYD